MKIYKDPGSAPPSERNLTVNQAEKCIMGRFKRQTKLTQANFTLKQHETWAKALKVARAWRADMQVVLPEPSSNRGTYTRRNKSGFVGVRLVLSTHKRGDREYPDWRWIAFWPGCQQTGGIGFSVKKYGDQGAFMRAYLARDFTTIDREWLEARVGAFMKTGEGRKILDCKLQNAVQLNEEPQ